MLSSVSVSRPDRPMTPPPPLGQVAHADQCEVQQSALRAVFDQLSVHGLEVAAPPEDPEQMAPLITALTGMLDAGEAEVGGAGTWK